MDGLPGADLPIADAIKLLYQTAKDLWTIRFVDVASVTVLVYDIMITFEDEVELVWKARWSLGKFLFFAVRYPPVIEAILWLIFNIDLDINENFCVFEQYLAIWGSFIFFIPLQAVIILRTSVLWSRKKSILWILGATTFVADLILLVTLSKVSKDFHFHTNAFLIPLLGCTSGLVEFNTLETTPAWVAIILFDTVIFILTLIRCISAFKTVHTRLFDVLVRDGFVYYTVMLAMNICNFVLLLALPVESGLATVLTPVSRASFSVVGSRIILNLNGVLAPPKSERDDTLDKGKSAMRMAVMQPGSGRSESTTLLSAFMPAHRPSVSFGDSDQTVASRSDQERSIGETVTMQYNQGESFLPQLSSSSVV